MEDHDAEARQCVHGCAVEGNHALSMQNVHNYDDGHEAEDLLFFHSEANCAVAAADCEGYAIINRAIHHPKRDLGNVSPLDNSFLCYYLVVLEPALRTAGSEKNNLTDGQAERNEYKQKEYGMQRLRSGQGYRVDGQ